jgi:hypothetical protein
MLTDIKLDVSDTFVMKAVQGHHTSILAQQNIRLLFQMYHARLFEAISEENMARIKCGDWDALPLSYSPPKQGRKDSNL